MKKAEIFELFWRGFEFALLAIGVNAGDAISRDICAMSGRLSGKDDPPVKWFPVLNGKVLPINEIVVKVRDLDFRAVGCEESEVLYVVDSVDSV